MPSDRGGWNCWRPARFTPAAIRSRRPARPRARWRRRSGLLLPGSRSTGSVPATSPWMASSRRRGACRCSPSASTAWRRSPRRASRCASMPGRIWSACAAALSQLYGHHAISGRPGRGRRLRGHGERQSVRAYEPFGCVAGAGRPRHSPQQLHGRGSGRDGNIGRPQPVDGRQGQRGQPGARGAWRHARRPRCRPAPAREGRTMRASSRAISATKPPIRPVRCSIRACPSRPTRPSCCCG